MVEQINSNTTSTGIDNPGVPKKKAKGLNEANTFSEQLSQIAQVQTPVVQGSPKLQEKAEVVLSKKKEDAAQIQLKTAPIPEAETPVMSQALSELGQKQIGLKANAKAETKSQLGPATSAEQAPTSMKSAVSMNTAGTIAGPKPWSKEWVFRVGDEENPGLKPLFPGKEKPLTDAQAAQLKSELEELQNLEQALKALGVQSQTMESTEKNLGGPNRVQGGEAGKTAIQGDPRTLSQSPMVGAEMVSVLGSNEMSGGQPRLEKGSAARPLRDPMAGASLGRRNGTTAGATALSGDEFVQTLNGVRTGAVRGHSELSGEETSAQNSKLQGPKPEMRRIEGGLKDKRTAIGDHKVTPAAIPPLWTQERPTLGALPGAEVAGHVVKGAMSQDRLSSESLLGMSTGIRGIAPQGAGEIRVRLKPDHLGELHVRVTAHGNDVRLKIQATDEHARKIIEESMSHLKDSLAEQNLSLARVEVTVGKALTQASHGDGQMDFGQSQHGSQRGDLLGQNSNQGNRNPNSEWVGGNDVTAPVRTGALKSQAHGAAVHGSNLAGGNSYREDGRLDITA